MKRTTKKLGLNRETVRNLTGAQLGLAAGGFTPTASWDPCGNSSHFNSCQVGCTSVLACTFSEQPTCAGGGGGPTKI
jgi:hypothetical protein